MKFFLKGILALAGIAILVFLALFIPFLIKQNKFNKATHQEQNLILYDEFCQNMRKHYYDQTFGGNDWNKVCNYWRKDAQNSPKPFILNIAMRNALSQLGTSHNDTFLKESNSPYSPPSPSGDAAKFISDKQEEFKDAIDVTGIHTATNNIKNHKFEFIYEIPGFKSDAKDYLKQNWMFFGQITLPVKSKDGKTIPVQYGYIIPKEYFSPDARTPISLQEYNNIGKYGIFGLRPIKVKFIIQQYPELHGIFRRELPNNILYLRFDSFLDNEISKQAAKAIKETDKNIILDMRYNRGGRADNVKRLLNSMMKSNIIIGYQKYNKKTYKIKTGLFNNPSKAKIIVLTGPNSSSGAEVMTSAIKNTNRGLVIGETTGGRLLSSKNYILTDGSIQQIAVMDYLDANKQEIEGVGVTPDIIVHPTLEGIKQGRDEILERAVQEISKTH